jgi:hypothetical protein
LRSLAQSMRNFGYTLTSADQTITAALNGVPWQGGDADRFRSQWHSSFRVQLHQAATMLETQSRALMGQADEQESASDEGGGASGSGGFDGVPASADGGGADGSGDNDLLDLFGNAVGDLGAWPPFQIANWITSAGGLGAERLLNAMARADLLTPNFGTAPEVGYLRGTQTLNALNLAGKFAGGLSILTGLGQAYQGIQSGDGHVVADGAITTILAAGSLTPTPAAPFFAAASLVWAGAQFLSGDVPVTERITDFASDAGDAISDGANALAEGAEDAWNWAFG